VYRVASFGSVAYAQPEKPYETVFRPFFTVFDRFPGGGEARFRREIKGPTVFRHVLHR
jgi:hypothetical protein